MSVPVVGAVILAGFLTTPCSAGRLVLPDANPAPQSIGAAMDTDSDDTDDNIDCESVPVPARNHMSQMSVN